MVSKEFKKFFFQYFRTFFFASLMGFLCLMILVGFGRSSFVRPHPIPLAMFFSRSSYVHHAFREVGCRNDAHNHVSPLALFVRLQHVLLQARLLCTLWTFRNAIHASCKSTPMTRRSCFAQHRFCRSMHVSQNTLGFHPAVSCLLRHCDFSRFRVLSCYVFAIVFASVAHFPLATALLPQF